MAEKKKILYIVEAMGGGVFTYIVDLANELVNSYDMYIAYAVRKQTPQNYKDYFDKRIHLIEVKNFGRAIDPAKDIAAFFEVKKMAAEIKKTVLIVVLVKKCAPSSIPQRKNLLNKLHISYRIKIKKS